MRQFTKLTKEMAQYKKGGTHILESALILTVMYDVEGEYVDHVYSVEVLDYHTGRTVDISAIMLEHFEDQTNDIVDTFDWQAAYHEHQLEQHDMIDAKQEEVYHMNDIRKALKI